MDGAPEVMLGRAFRWSPRKCVHISAHFLKADMMEEYRSRRTDEEEPDVQEREAHRETSHH